jgi:hypothetical protein
MKELILVAMKMFQLKVLMKLTASKILEKQESLRKDPMQCICIFDFLVFVDLRLMLDIS